MADPEVVVIIPTTRIDDWLSIAVRSILGQQGVSARVVVIHDGVEPDTTQSWMQSPRVTALHSVQRVGLSAVLSRAIGETLEPMIARLDADDISFPDRLATQIDYLRAHPETVLVGSQGVRIDGTGRVTGEINTATGDDIRPDLLMRNVLVHSSVVFRREPYFAAGGFDPRIRLMEDYDLWMRMAIVGPIANLPSRLVSYRVHSSQMTRGAKPYGPHISKVLQSHRALSKSMHVSNMRRARMAFIWLGAQYLRYWRIRKPGYDR